MFSAFLDKDVYVFLHYLLSLVLVSVTEETEQVEEKVDEIQVQREAAEQRDAESCVAVGIAHLNQHVFDLLGVVGRQSGEDNHAGVVANRHQGVVLEENIDQRGDDQSDECHIKDAADHRQIALDEQTDESHRAEHAGGDEERLRNRTDLEHQKDGREEDAVQQGVDREENTGRGDRKAHDARRNEPHDAQFSTDESPEEEFVGENGVDDFGLRGDCHGGKSRNGQRQRHPQINILHHGDETYTGSALRYGVL